MARIRRLIFQSSIPESESDYERKRRSKQIETIRDIANTVLNLYDKWEQQEEEPEQGLIISDRIGE
jgi:hypothetical protein